MIIVETIVGLVLIGCLIYGLYRLCKGDCIQSNKYRVYLDGVDIGTVYG